jgi:hypothetical protein
LLIGRLPPWRYCEAITPRGGVPLRPWPRSDKGPGFPRPGPCDHRSGFKGEGGRGVGDYRVNALKDSRNKKIARVVLRDNVEVSGLINPFLPFGAAVTGDRRIVFKYIKHENTDNRFLVFAQSGLSPMEI